MKDGAGGTAAARRGSAADGQSLGPTGLAGSQHKHDSLTAVCLLILASVGFVCALSFLRPILVPFFYAVLISSLLQPVVNLLSRPPRRWCDKCCKRHGERCCEGVWSLTRSRRYSELSDPGGAASSLTGTGTGGGGGAPFRHRSADGSVDYTHDDHMHARRTCLDYPIVPRWLAVIVAVIAAISLVVVLGAIVYGSVMNLESQFYRYEEGASEVAKTLKGWLALGGYSLDEDVVPWLFATAKNMTPKVLAWVVGACGYGVYVTIFVTFILISPSRPIPSSAWGAIDLHIRRYIRLKSAICMCVGAITGCILWALNVQLAWVLGLVAAVLNYLPNIGPMIATLLPAPLVLLDPDLGMAARVAAFALPTVLHLAVGNFVEPKVFGESFSLSPVVVLLNVAFTAQLWGLPGAILSVPLLVCVRITCLHLAHPYARTAVALLEGRIFEAHLDALTVSSHKPSWGGDMYTTTYDVSGGEGGKERHGSRNVYQDLDPV